MATERLAKRDYPDADNVLQIANSVRRALYGDPVKLNRTEIIAHDLRDQPRHIAVLIAAFASKWLYKSAVEHLQRNCRPFFHDLNFEIRSIPRASPEFGC